MLVAMNDDLKRPAAEPVARRAGNSVPCVCSRCGMEWLVDWYEFAVATARVSNEKGSAGRIVARAYRQAPAHATRRVRFRWCDPGALETDHPVGHWDTVCDMEEECVAR